MISAPLPSAPVRSNLNPLQEAIIHWGKSCVFLKSFISTIIAPSLCWLIAICLKQSGFIVAVSFPSQYLTSQTQTAPWVESDTLALKSTRKLWKKKFQKNWQEVWYRPAPTMCGRWGTHYRWAVCFTSCYGSQSIRLTRDVHMIIEGQGLKSEKGSMCSMCSAFFSGLNNTICRLITVKLINKVLIESKLLSCVSCVAVSETQLPFFLSQQIIFNMSLFTLS